MQSRSKLLRAQSNSVAHLEANEVSLLSLIWLIDQEILYKYCHNITIDFATIATLQQILLEVLNEK